MEYLYVVLPIVVALFFLFLFLRERREKREVLRKQEQTDLEYTKQLARGMEQEEELTRIKRDFGRQQEMAEEIRRLHEKTRLLKHDMKNHIMVITSFLNENKLEESKQYISNILDDLNKMYTYIQVGNALLCYIINSKFQEAAGRDVAIKAEIKNLSFEGIESVDFSALLNNLLDNAIEAAAQANEKRMVVNILEKKGWSNIYVANTVRESVLEKNPELISSKGEEGHGYGMKQIRRIVDKYQGMLDIYEEDGYFCVNVMFPVL